jgi:hypothetical protein
MAEHLICNWTGASGASYKFYIWELPVNFNEGQNGNYIYSKRNAAGRWVPIYIGQGDLKDRSENHHKSSCISSKGATHIHVHLNSTENDRLTEEQDLLAFYKNAYTPLGCNEKEWG